MKNIFLINLNKDKSNKNKYISSTLLYKIEENIKLGKKILIYLNKKGDFSSLLCNKCEYLYKCPKCDISLTVYNKRKKLECHYCNYNINIPSKCIKCGKNDFTLIGIGTEQIEDFLKKYFGNIKIFRMDNNSVKTIQDKKLAINNINNSDIIIGTKMITTGFNIKNLGLIGIILLEQELQIPEYNTEEKAYQNIKQLIGRGGRINQETDILIQTFIPDNNIIKQITQSNYKDFFINTINERKIFNYPPFCELKTIKYKNKNKEKALKYIKKLEEKLINLNTENKYEINLISNYIKRNNQFHYKIIIKGNNIHNLLKNIKKELLTNKDLSIY